jgi:hypothetical protein
MKIIKFLATLLFTSNFNLFAQCALDQFQDSSDAGRSARNLPGYYEGQTFVPAADGLLCQVAMKMFSAGSGTGTLNIYADSGLTGNLIHTQLVTVNTLIGGSVWQNWTLNIPPLVIGGQTYTFQFVPDPNGGINDPYGVDLLAADFYAAGNDLGEPTWDLCFQTYVDVPTGIIIQNNNSSDDFAVYPNPVCDKLYVNCYNGYQLFAIDGRLLKESTWPCKSIDVADLNEGMYILKSANKSAKIMVKR